MGRCGLRPSISFTPLVALLCACILLTPHRAPAQDPGPITFDPGVDYAVHHGAEGASAADLDGDGHLDIVATCDLDLVVLYGVGDGTLEPAVYFPIGPDVYVGQVTSGDVDGDHLPDLVFARGRSNVVGVLKNLGNRTFSAPVFYTVGTNPFGVHLRDLNGDGAPELLAANNGSNNLTVYYNNGSGIFGSRVDYGGGSFPARIVSGDWDKDGDVDLAMSNYTSKNITTYFNDGTGHFVRGANLAVGDYPAQIVTDDFNRDGKLDVATANTFSHNLTVYLGSGTGAFTLLNTYAANTYPHIMASGDLDGDLYPDLAVPNNSTNYFTPFRNEGGTSFTKLSTVTSDGDDLRTLAIGDMDEDGRPDVITTEGNSLFVTVFLNRTDIPVPAAPVLISATPVDYSHVDLVWQDIALTETAFRIDRKALGGSFAEVGRVGKNQTTFSDPTAVGGVTYVYRVVALNAGGDSDPSNELQLTMPPPPPNAPDGLQVSEDTPGSVHVTWNDNSGDETGFDLERQLSGSGSAHLGLNANTTEYVDPNVTGNRSYTYRVRAYHGPTFSGYSNAVTYLTRPARPNNLAATAISTSRINLSWSNPNGAGVTSSIERSSDGGMTWTEFFTGAAGTLVTFDPGLLLLHEYRYRGRYLNGSGYSAYTDPVVETTFPNPPAAPSGLSVQTVSASQLHLTWSDLSDNETAFRIQRKDLGFWVEMGEVGAGVTEYTDSILAANTPQLYRVLAANRGGLSGPTNEASGLTLPLKPTNLAVAPHAQLRLDLTWTDPNPIKAATKVERSENGGQSYTPVTTLPAGTAAYQDGSLEPSKTYTYRLLATNAAGDAAPTNSVNGTTWPLPPAAPTGLQITDHTQTLISLAWTDPPSNATGIRVERLNGAQWQTLTTLGPNATTYEAGGLQPETDYTFRVVSFNSGGDCAGPPQVTGATLPTPPGAPSGLTATAPSAGALVLDWSSVPGAASYRIERKVGSGGAFVPVATPAAGAMQWSDSGLPELTVCTYRLFAVNEGGESPPAEVGATTLPLAPTNVTAQVHVHEVLVTWTDESQAESGYRVEQKQGSGAFQNLIQLPVNSASFLHTPVTPGVVYTYRVTALGPGGTPVSLPGTSGPVTAPGLASGGKLTVSPRALNFGTVKSGTTKSKTFTVKNTGKTALTLFVTEAAAPFHVSSGQGTFILNPKASRKVTVQLLAPSAGSPSGAVAVSSNNTATANVNVGLKGKVK